MDHEDVGGRVRSTIQAINGTTYLLGMTAETLYRASGISHDYAVARANYSMSFTMELPGGGSQGFDIPASRIPDVIAETRPGLVVFAEYVAEKWGNLKKSNN